MSGGAGGPKASLGDSSPEDLLRQVNDFFAGCS